VQHLAFFGLSFLGVVMGITILSPLVEDAGASLYNSNAHDSDSDVDMDRSPTKRPRLDANLKGIGYGSGTVVPGEMVTSDPQWMR
jgi:exosome complex component RRP4